MITSALIHNFKYFLWIDESEPGLETQTRQKCKIKLCCFNPICYVDIARKVINQYAFVQVSSIKNKFYLNSTVNFGIPLVLVYQSSLR